MRNWQLDGSIGDVAGDRNGRVAWVLREYPYGVPNGQNVWIASLLESSRASGIENIVVLPRGNGLPLSLSPGGGSPLLVSRDLVRMGPVALAHPRQAARQLLWNGYRCLPLLLQRVVAGTRRSIRRRRRVDHVLGRDWTPDERGWLVDVLTELAPEKVVFDSPFSDPGLPGPFTRILLMHDVIHQRAASFASLGYRTVPIEVTEEWESARIRAADAVVTIQWDDAETTRRMVPGMPVVVAPPTFASPPSPPGGTDGSCLFVGNGTMHNVDGLRWMLSDVWPAIRAAVPSATLRVVGAVCGQVTTGAPGVEMLGQVRDLRREYERAAVVVVPLRAGSGLKVKLAEAISHGRPAVATTVGAQGLMALEPRPFLVEDTAPGFGAAVCRVLTDPTLRGQLQMAATAAGQAFAPESAHRQLVDLLGAPAWR